MSGRRAELAVVAVAVVGGMLARFGPASGAGRFGALLGVALAVGSSVVALVIKRWGLARSLQASMLAMGLVFFLRLVLVVGGMFGVRAAGGSMVAYVVAFFSAYLVLQWIEIADALSEDRRRDRGEM